MAERRGSVICMRTGQNLAMEQDYPLARLAELVSGALSQNAPMRLVLRNTERLGIVHLYFDAGQLRRVEGHRTPAAGLLADLATWTAGTIRVDAMPQHIDGADGAGGAQEQQASQQLSTSLAEALHSLQQRRVVAYAPSPRLLGAPTATSQASQPSRVTPLPMWQQSAPGHLGGPTPLPRTPLGGGDPSQPSIPPSSPAPRLGASSQATDERLTAPQWQLIALVVRQVVEQAGQRIGLAAAENVLHEALAHTGRTRALLRTLDIDATGWLVAPRDLPISSYGMFEVVDSIAALLTSFELRVAALVGETQARRIVVTATAPFRASLAQIGLDISE